jgi:ParB family chromosome partitioning protein
LSERSEHHGAVNILWKFSRDALPDHVGIPLENEPDPLSEAEVAFAPQQPKASKPKKNTAKSKETLTLVKPPQKRA